MPIDAIVLGFIAIGAVILAFVAGQSMARGRALDAIADLAGTPDADDPEVIGESVRRLAREAADLALKLEQERRDMAYLANLVGIGIVRLSDDLRVEFANAAAHHFLGREPGSMAGRTAIEAFRDHGVEAVAVAARGGPATTAEVQLRPPDGPVLVVRARRSPILGVWIVLEDVAELRRLQRIRSEFIDNISHELRTPIATVGLLSETLERDAAAAADVVPPIKFSPDGGDVLVAVRSTGDGRVEAAVEDHGIGISRSDLPRIFERFYKADRARVRGGGTGLGLAITRHIVEGHGGQIRAESELGVGTTFTISLPVAEARTSEAEGRWTG